jgi:hypothetical protein|tara:strand:+ start:1877 stop:2041 length:165 start_codon:yes stop_codon:yes gene_type:complete
MKRLALIIFGLLTILEGVINTLLYVTFMDKVFPAADFAITAYIRMIKVPDDGNK